MPWSPAELKEAVRTWPHTDPVSWAQRTSTVSLLRRLDESLAKAVLALQRHDPKYYKGRPTHPLTTEVGLHTPELQR